MATTVTSTRPLAKKGTAGGPLGRGPGGNGAPKPNGDRPLLDPSSASRYRLGTWVALASIIMLFTALSSAYIVRAASSSDWQPLRMPRILLLSSVLLLISSGTLETARRKLKSAATGAYKSWLFLTVLLGVGFLASQLIAWRQLAKQGVYIASNPHSSFFYLFTALHGVHLFGGLAALAYLSLRSRLPREETAALASSVTKAQAKAVAVTLFGLFMDFLWIYLFVLLFYVR